MPRPFALAAILLFGLSALAPAAGAAGVPAQAGSVGAIFVDAQGLASGQNLAAHLSEAQGVVSGFTSLALGEDVFDQVAVDGFSQAEKIQGVGSSSVTLSGSNAIITLTDTTRTLLAVHALDATTVHLKPAEHAHARALGERRGVVELRDDAGRLLGTLVAFGDDGPASRGEVLAVGQDEITAQAKAGTQLVFLGGADALHASLVEGLAQGSLAALDVVDYRAGATAAALTTFGGDVFARSAAIPGGLQTTLASRGQGAALLAYDLAYEALPARSPSEVALYADGRLALRAASPAEVVAHARDLVASYFAQAQDGRVDVLVSTPALGDGQDHSLSLQARAQASTESGAHAERQGDESSRAYGGFDLSDNGKLTGRFSTSIVRRDALQMWGYTELGSGAEVFRNLTVSGGAIAQAQADGERFSLAGADATLRLVDDALATLTLEARHPVDASWETGADVQARPRGDHVIALEGPKGHAGDIILVGGGSLRADSAQLVSIRLDAGSTLVFRGAPDAFPSDDALAQAIAAGRVGAHVLAGVQGAATAASATAYNALVTVSADAQRSAVDAQYLSNAALAQAFVLDARGAGLAAKTSADVQVTVDGAPALSAATLADALARGSQARYFAETSADGALRVVVNTAAATGHAAHVVVSSKAEAAARAASNTDAFGTFHLFDDGAAVGSFVTLKVDAAAGAVSGYTLVAAGQPVFASIAAGASGFASQGVDGASTLLLESREARLEFADTTSGFAKVVAKAPTTVAFRLAEGLHAESRGDGVVEVVTEGGRDLGSLVLGGAGGLAQSGQDVVSARLDAGAQVLFKAHVGIENELSAAQRAMIARAIAEGRVAGAVLVQTQAGLGSSARAAARALESTSGDARDVTVGAAEQGSGLVTAAVTTSYYSDVQMVTAATKDRVDVTVSSSSPQGRTILVSLDGKTVGGLATGDAEILFDGQPAREASSYADVLNPDDDHGQAEYFVLAGDAGAQVLVSVPHFSVHTVTLRERSATANGAYMYATFALGAVVIAESVLLYRRHKKG